MGIKQIKKEKEKTKQKILNRIPTCINIIQYYIDNFPPALLYRNPVSSPISPSDLLSVSYLEDYNIDDFFEEFLSELYKSPFPSTLKKKIEIKLESLKLSILSDEGVYLLIRNKEYIEEISRFIDDFKNSSEKEDFLMKRYNDFLEKVILLEIKNSLILLFNLIIPELINYIKNIIEEF